MSRPRSLLLTGLLAACSHPAPPGSAAPSAGSVVAPTLVEQESHTTALLQAVSAVNDSVVWVSGHRATWARTSDGGRTWMPGAMTGPDSVLQFRDVHGVDASTAYLLAAGNGGRSRIYKTSDAGRTWQLQFLNRDSTAFYDCFDFWDATHGVAVSDAVNGRMLVLATEDGGAHWNQLAGDGMPAALKAEGSPAASGTCLIVRDKAEAWFGTEPGARVFHSADRGRHWSVVTTPIVSGEAAGIAAFAFRDAPHGLALGARLLNANDRSDSVVARTDDGGATWQLMHRPPFSGAVYGAAAVPGLASYYVAVGPKGFAWTADAGNAWSSLSSNAYWAVGFASREAGWAVGPGGRITRIAW